MAEVFDWGKSTCRPGQIRVLVGNQNVEEGPKKDARSRRALALTITF